MAFCHWNVFGIPRGGAHIFGMFGMSLGSLSSPTPRLYSLGRAYSMPHLRGWAGDPQPGDRSTISSGPVSGSGMNTCHKLRQRESAPARELEPVGKRLSLQWGSRGWQRRGPSSWTIVPPPGERPPKGGANTEENRARRRKGDKFTMTALKRPAPDLPLRFVHPCAFLFRDQ